MAKHAILAEKTINLSALRSNPAQYFGDQAVAVLSHNTPVGYMLGAELFEYMLNFVETHTEARRFQAGFRPSPAQLQALRSRGADLILKATATDREDYEE